MTDYSFKTRLFKIHYVDSSGNISDYVQYGFFLEPKKHIEMRLGLKNIDVVDLLTMKDKIIPLLDTKVLSLVNAFELMIANYDYAISGMFSHIINDHGYGVYYGEKNSKIFQDNSGNMVPFIYDFDFSRFGFNNSICNINFTFFFENYDYNTDCSVESLVKILNRDLEMFHYKYDFQKNLKVLIEGLTQWKLKNEDLISFIGADYKLGVQNFIKALKFKAQSF